MNGFTIDIKGIPEAKRMFEGAGIQFNKASREYVTKMGRQVVKQMKQEIRSDGDYLTGSLFASIDTKVPYFNRLGYYVSISGPRKNFTHFIRWRKNGGALFAQPYRYAHLVEKGSYKTGIRHTESGASRGIMPAHNYTEHSYEKLKVVNISLAKQIYEKALNG